MIKRLRRLVAVTLAVLLIPIGIGRIQSALACSCAPDPRGYEDDAANADAVFDGVATQQSPPFPDPLGSVTFRFDVSNVVKGSVTDPQDVTTSSSGSLCGVSFEIGRAYRVFAYRSGGSLSTGLCSGNRALTGYRLAAADGGVFAFGASSFSGSAGGSTPPSRGPHQHCAGRGRHQLRGRVLTFGADSFGDLAGLRLNAPVVAISG